MGEQKKGKKGRKRKKRGKGGGKEMEEGGNERKINQKYRE